MRRRARPDWPLPDMSFHCTKVTPNPGVAGASCATLEPIPSINSQAFDASSQAPEAQKRLELQPIRTTADEGGCNHKWVAPRAGTKHNCFLRRISNMAWFQPLPQPLD